MRDKQYVSTEKGLDDLADLMLNRINSCVDDRTKKTVKIKSAVVTKVNDDGTVNVQLPDDEGDGFTRLQNQSVFELNVGDSVEVLLKEGSFTNSWVIAKHGGGTKRVNLVNQGTVSVISGGSSSSGSSSGGSGGSGSGDEALELHIANHSNPHAVTKAQVGLENVDNVQQYSASNPPPYPVSSVNSKTGTVVLTASDVGALPNTTSIPSKTSELTNDSGFLTSSDVNYPVTRVNDKTGVVTLTASDVGALSDTTEIPSKTSDLTNDSGFITSSDIPDIPVQSVNGKTGAVELTASDVGAISTSVVTTTLTDSDEQIPTSKAVADAMAAAGNGDMLKAKYAPNSEDTVEKAYKDEDGNNIKSTYQKKGGILSNTDLNTVTESGNYFLGSDNTNIPDDCTGNIMMVGGASTAAFQAIFKFSTNSIVHRCYNGTTWTNWRDTNTALIVSSTQPTNQSAGDLWYQIVE